MTFKDFAFIILMAFLFLGGITLFTIGACWVARATDVQVDPSEAKDLNRMMPRGRDQAIYDELRAIRRLLEDRNEQRN